MASSWVSSADRYRTPQYRLPTGPNSLRQSYWHHHPQSTRSEIVLDSAIQKLHRNVDYHAIGVALPSRLSKEMALADGLAYIQVLLRQQTRGCTRALATVEVVRRLIELLPSAHLIAAGVPRTAVQLVPAGGFAPSHLRLLTATASYIAELKLKKKGKYSAASQSTVCGTGVPRPATASEQTKTKGEATAIAKTQEACQSATTQNTDKTGTEAAAETLTEKALSKMEDWADRWLDGRLKEDDWKTFKDCLDTSK